MVTQSKPKNTNILIATVVHSVGNNLLEISVKRIELQICSYYFNFGLKTCLYHTKELIQILDKNTK